MLTHKGTREIKTQRLVLRAFKVTDAKEMFFNWANDERVTKFLTWAPHTGVEETEKLLDGWCELYSNLDYYNWVIELEGKVIGNISVVRQDDNSERAELGYCLGFDFWNKGYMTEAVLGVVNFLFKEINCNRVVIAHAKKNVGSGLVAKKCGFTFEGIQREHFKGRDGEFLDIVITSLLRSEWGK